MARGYEVRVPDLCEAVQAAMPTWPRIVDEVRRCVEGWSADPLVLVAHSNAGLYVPVIRDGLRPRRVTHSLFVDATLPARSGSTPVAWPGFVGRLREMAVGGVVPRWTDWWSGVAEQLPEPVRDAVVAEQPRLPLAYFEQDVPVPDGWDDHVTGYVWFSEAYEGSAVEAGDRGWPVVHLPASHLHQIVDPGAVSAVLAGMAGAAR